VKGRSAGHRAHAEHVHLARLAIEQHPAFIPVHLRLAAELIGLRHKDLVPKQAHGRLAHAHIPANRRSRDFHFRHLAPQSHPDPMRSVPLFSGCLAVRLQDRVDKRNRWRQLRMLALGHLPFRRNRALQRPAYLPSMHPQLPRHRPDRARTVFVLPSDLLV